MLALRHDRFVIGVIGADWRLRAAVFHMVARACDAPEGARASSSFLRVCVSVCVPKGVQSSKGVLFIKDGSHNIIAEKTFID